MPELNKSNSLATWWATRQLRPLSTGSAESYAYRCSWMLHCVSGTEVGLDVVMVPANDLGNVSAILPSNQFTTTHTAYTGPLAGGISKHKDD